MEERVKKELYRILGLLDIQIEMIEAWLYGKEVLVPRKCGVTTAKQAKELLDFIEQELSKAREEGKKEAFTKDEWFMLKLAMNDIFNSGNTAYEEISKKIEGYLKGELSGEAEHIKAHKEYLATSKQDTPEQKEEWEEKFMDVLETFKDEICSNFFASSKPLTDFIQQLLEERETFTKGELNNLLDWIENGYVPSIEARDEIDKGIIEKVVKLLNKK